MTPGARPHASRRAAAGSFRRHNNPTCPFTGKRRYRDTNQAADALIACRRAHEQAEFFGRPSLRNETRAFPCACLGWHLTSAPLEGTSTPEAA
jgi:hypothetical protein